MIFLVIVSSLVLFASWKFSDSYLPVQGDQAFKSPSFEHWLGTDSLGRDYFWRLVLALRTSLFVALGSTVVSFVIGLALGSLSAVSLGPLGFTLNRFFDLVQGLPSFLFLAVIMQFFVSSSGLVSLLALAIFCGSFHWPQIARLTRSQLFKTSQEPFVEASQSIGASTFHILRKHLWPSAFSLWISWFCYHLPSEIMFESTLSFLGLGIQPPQTSLGLLIQEGWKYLDDQPLFLFAPAILTFLIVLSLRSLLKWKFD